MSSQLNMRLRGASHAALVATAADLGVSVSELVREHLEGHLDEILERARKNAAERAGHLNISEEAVERATRQLIAEINRGEHVLLNVNDLFAARGRAVYDLLTVIWATGDYARHRAAVDAIAERLADIKPPKAKPPKKPTAPDPAPDDRPLRPYPRRRS